MITWPYAGHHVWGEHFAEGPGDNKNTHDGGQEGEAELFIIYPDRLAIKHFNRLVEHKVQNCLKGLFRLRERPYITSSRQGGVGGPDTNDDIDDALRGGGGVTIKMMM